MPKCPNCKKEMTKDEEDQMWFCRNCIIVARKFSDNDKNIDKNNRFTF